MDLIKLLIHSTCILLLLTVQFNLASYSSLQNPIQASFPLFDFNNYNIEIDDDTNNNKPLISSPTPTPRYRLPLNVLPIHYILKQQIVLDDMVGYTRFTAPSQVTISIICIEQTSTITLHKYYGLITIDQPNVKVTGKNETQISIKSHAYEDDKDFYIITINGLLEKNEIYEIFIPFLALIPTNTSFGLYGAPYEDPENPGQTRYMSVTTLEPNYARRVFPCFDEPNLKATFDIIIGHTSAYQSLSHTAINTSVTQGDWIWDSYDRTVIMPTYLICNIVVSTDFSGKNATDGLFRTPVAAWAHKSIINSGGGDFAAETSAKSLDYFEKTYKFPYSLSKLDSITIPGFPAGALENWGLNTYRETTLIWNQNINSESNKGSSSSTISHEISHQWFGNLVSCIFWEQIWLNEGVANYMSFRGVQHTHPEFHPHMSFPSDSVQPGMRADQSPNSHPVKFVTMPTNWMDIFDTISYSKGGAILKMTEGFLSEEIATNGFIDFIQKMAYKGADQDDLFESFQTAASQASVNPLPNDLTVKDILDTWTLQSGYPLIRVTKAGSSRIFISQEKFSLTPLVNDDVLWNVPLKIVTKSQPDTLNKIPNLWLRKTNVLTSYGDGIDTSEWIMLNPDATGFYRVHYDTSLYELIKNQLENDPNVISAGSRSQLLDDYWNFVLGQYIHINTFLELTKYLGKEINLVVWSSILGNLRSTHTILSGSTAGFAELQKYLLPKIESSLNEIGWEQLPNDAGSPIILRSLLLDWACSFESDKCLSEATRLFEQWEGQTNPNPIPIPIDIQSIYFCGAVAKLGQSAYDFILTQYKTTGIPLTLKSRLLNALACSTSESLLTSLMDTALNPDEIRVVDKTTVFQKIGDNPYGRTIVYEFIKSKLNEPNVGPGLFTSVISTLSTHWHLQNDITQLNQFIEDNESIFNPSQISSLQGSIRRIENNIDWMEKTGSLIVDWMMKN